MSDARVEKRPVLAVIFDLDGVLIDSEHVWERVRRAFVAEWGGTYHDGATRDVMGMNAPEWSHYIRTRLGVDLPEPRINELVAAGVAAAYDAESPLIPGAVDAVRRIAARVPVAIASSANRSLIELVVRQAGLTETFSAIVSAEEVPRGKPAPDVYLRAAERLGIAATSCAAIEDSSNGIRSAHASGAFTVAIPNRDFPPDADALELANVVLPDIVALDGAVLGLPTL